MLIAHWKSFIKGAAEGHPFITEIQAKNQFVIQLLIRSKCFKALKGLQSIECHVVAKTSEEMSVQGVIMNRHKNLQITGTSKEISDPIGQEHLTVPHLWGEGQY